MQWSTISRFPALSLMAATCLAACAESSAPSTSENAVDTAYAALVSEIASCARELETCVDAAADDAAIDACRAELSSCREDAGKKNVDALANAARSCSATHKECVKAAEKGEAGSCQDELRVCLRASRPQGNDDDDAGTDNDARKAARADCLDELHPCVKADGPANACAEQVRMCLVDSAPSPLMVVPDKKADKDRSDSDADAAVDEDGMGMGKSAKGDAGMEHGKSGGAKPADDADAGVRGKAKTTPARECVDTLRACIDAGNPARGCAQSLKECRAAALP
jgi:hypothetical protein